MSAAGIPLPLPQNIGNIPAPQLRLSEKNARNLRFKDFNKTSIAATRAYERAASSTVVLVLRMSATLSELSTKLVGAVGPLPTSVTYFTAKDRMATAKEGTEPRRRPSVTLPLSSSSANPTQWRHLHHKQFLWQLSLDHVTPAASVSAVSLPHLLEHTLFAQTTLVYNDLSKFIHHRPSVTGLGNCFPFGAAHASSNTGQICNALMDIWQAEIGTDGRPFKYEDDALVTRVPNANGLFSSLIPTPSHISPSSHTLFHYRFDRDSIVALIDSIETPWHPAKSGLHFLNTSIFLGFGNLCRVGFLSPKRSV
ncbi:hypothetical protein B0H16DRAFT_1711793 [Mycena metata]|uniref:Uncharacterized protein n=1 Tax=Mycena metata TaxID=1033252 RepID=A0AAD7NWN6_9AGAR|nr:hypothetical protein B0H16DRAFT_1711793 [Mycena metata]